MAKGKYEYMETPKPVDIPIGDRQIVSVEMTKSKRVEDGMVFTNINLLSGFNGRRGFVANKINACVNLPLGLTTEHWKTIVNAYNDFSKEASK